MTLVQRYEWSGTPLEAGLSPAAADFPGWCLMPPTLRLAIVISKSLLEKSLPGLLVAPFWLRRACCTLGTIV